jgi:hypothetical protein
MKREAKILWIVYCAVVHSQNMSYQEQRQPPDQLLCCCAQPEHVL